MKKFILTTLLLLSFCGIKSVCAQQQSDSIPPSGNDIILQGIELFDNGKYDDAIKTFKKVSECDPEYARACYETALAYNNLGDYAAALQKCQESIILNPADIQAGVLKGNLLDELARRDEAINWLEILEKKYPYNQNLLYNLAICHLNNGEPQKAEEILLKGLHYNPYHASSHLALARINYIMGRKAQSYLAYNMAILMNPRVDYIKRFEEAISGQADSILKSYLYPYSANVEHAKWDYITGLLDAEIAFREDFPYEYKLSFLSCRQSFLLFQKMVFDEKDTTIYNQFYVRFFKKVSENKEFETYINYTLKNTNNKLVNDWLEKNATSIDKFIARARESINSWREYGFSTVNEGKHQKKYHFNDDGDLESIGILSEAPQPSKEGIWHFISETGAISQKAFYQNNLREGESLIYWPDGSVKQKLNFKNDKFNGLNYTYHPNGVKSGIYPRNEDIADGLEEEYNSANKLVSRQPYISGKTVGSLTFTDYANGFSREIPFVNDKREGLFTEEWLNGNKKTEGMYADSLLNGTYKKWYANGQPEWEGLYEKNIQTGKYISYYANGSKSSEGTFDETGNPTGIYTEFDHSGLPTQQISGYKNGKSDGTQTYYFPDGKERAKFVLQEDVIKHVDCFNISGAKVYTADEKDGVLNYKYFFPEGLVKIEGKLKDGLKDGIWKSYSILGKVISEENWIGGIQSGLQQSFHENGNPELVYTCDSGKISGKIVKYFRSGHVYWTGYYNAGGYTGEWITYYSNDSVETRAYFANNKIAGRRMRYSPNGKLTTEETFNTDGEPIRIKYFDFEGKLTDELNFPYDSVNLALHFPDGKIKAKLSRSDRKLHGIQEYFHPNGKLKNQQTYIYGNAQGVSQEWDHHGNPVDIRNYCMNELDGKWRNYENGKLVSTDSFEMGLNHGLYQEFHPNGHVFRTLREEAGERQGNSDCFAPDSTWMYSIQYRDDEICSVSFIDNQGKLHTNERIDDKTKEIVCYYKNGKVSARIPFAKGIFNGKHAIYYSNGQLLRELSYVNDYREGLSNYYYENGKLKESCEWLNGSKSGHYNSFFSTGQKELEGNYLANKKLGKWLVYNETGKIVETLYYENDELYDIK
jgi:antitoxin component YwqK of YwqJK toxin-antitoxin module/Tfp pilus assembly protein PilF